MGRTGERLLNMRGFRSGDSSITVKETAGGVEARVNAAALGKPLTRANDTNVTLTLGGSPLLALLAPVLITAGWQGTLAAGRLNANVVQAITNDANIQGSIAAQVLTLAWAGMLSKARGGTGQGTYDVALLDAALTSGRIPIATSGGRLTDGPAPVADGTYNFDAATPGNVTSITFTKGIATAVATLP